MRRVLSPTQRLWVISTLLVALVVRALIPAGFMPAADRPFSFQICPDGFPAALLQDGAALPASAHEGHHHHDNGEAAHAGHHAEADGLLAAGHQHGEPLHDHGGPLHHGNSLHGHGVPLHNHGAASAEHCVFAAAAGVFAVAFAATYFALTPSIVSPEAEVLPSSYESLRFRLAQPRGPPALS